MGLRLLCLCTTQAVVSLCIFVAFTELHNMINTNHHQKEKIRGNPWSLKKMMHCFSFYYFLNPFFNYLKPTHRVVCLEE